MIFKRLLYIIKSIFSSTLNEFENPLDLLDQKIKNMEQILNEAKYSSAKILGSISEIERTLQNLSKRNDQYTQYIKLALNKGDQLLAKKILEKKLDNDKYFDSLSIGYNDANEKGEALKLQLSELQQNIYDTKIYRSLAFARYNTSEAQKKINEIIFNISESDNSICISNIEAYIQKRECFTYALNELDFDHELKNELASLNKLHLNLKH